MAALTIGGSLLAIPFILLIGFTMQHIADVRAASQGGR